MDRAKNNRILSALPETEYRRLIGQLEPVQLSKDEILIEADRYPESLYFITEGLVSLVSVMRDGSTTEIGIMGKEALVGTPQFLGNGVSHSPSVVQVPGSAMRIDAAALQTEFDRSQSLPRLLQEYQLNFFNQVSQCSACNNHHTVKQRMARWLLMLDDRSEKEVHFMTQRLLSRMLGVRRTGVTEVANQLKQAEIIDYQRGQITILDRPALEEIACECYQIIKD